MENSFIQDIENLKKEIQEVTVKKRTCEAQIDSCTKEKKELEERCKNEFDIDVENLDDSLSKLNADIKLRTEKLKKMLGI